MGLGATLRRLAGAFSRPPARQLETSRYRFVPEIPDFPFAVVDVETTGLYPRGRDRIIEIAVVRTDWTGRVLEEYCTLVNPCRDVGPTSIHHIGAHEIVSAPRFEEIAGDLADRLAESILAGHNISFDLRFIEAEFSRINAPLPSLQSVCTLALSGLLRPPPINGRLSSCCTALGIPHAGAHSALGDAQATAQLLAGIIGQVGWRHVQQSSTDGAVLSRDAFPDLTRSGRSFTRRLAATEFEEAQSYLSRLITAMPLAPAALLGDANHRTATLAYLDLLNRALEDRFMSAHEAMGLVALAEEWGLTGELVGKAHGQYLLALARAAVADGLVTESEREDLMSVTCWLGLTEDDLDEALRLARMGSRAAWDAPKEELVGKRVCFTGEPQCTLRGEPISRDYAERLVANAGLVVASGVSKKLDILVCADPLSQSGKARKARDYGTRIVSEVVFWQMLGVPVD